MLIKNLFNCLLLLLALCSLAQINNIAGRLPENSRNSFVDLQSQKQLKRQTKKLLFSDTLDCKKGEGLKNSRWDADSGY